MIKLKTRLEKVRSRPYPALSESRPRAVKLNGAGICLLWLALAALGAAVPLGVWMFTIAERERLERQAFQREAVVARAEVNELTRTHGEDARYYARYHFAAGGRYYQSRATVPRGRWQRLKVGSSLDIVYLPSDPSRSWLQGREPKGMPLWVGPIMGLGLLLAGVVMLAPIRSQRRLLSEGRAVRGHVISTKKVHDGHQVNFEFRLMSGAARTGKYGPVSAMPAIGEQVEIVYDPEHPEHYSRLPLSLVSPVQNDVLGR